MTTNLSGTPGVKTSISDLSIVTPNITRGIICVQAVTKRGKPGEQYLIPNWTQYRRRLGGLIQGVDDPLICKRALEKGAVLRVTRAFNYTDVADLSTVSGDVATVTLTDELLDITFNAEAVGDGYNGAEINITEADSGNTDNVDIRVQLPDSDVEAVVNDVPRTAIDPEDIETLNSRLRGANAGVEVDSITTEIPVTSGSLAGGTQDSSLIVEADYNGSEVSKSGWHAFDDVTDSMRIANINKAIPEVDQGLSDYVTARGDMRAIVRMPLGLTISGIADYRNGEGAYDHSPLDSFYTSIWYTNVEVTDPENASIKDRAITAIGDYLARRSITDRQAGEWISASGEEYGKMTGINKVDVNLISPGNKGLFNPIYEAGVNAIVDHPTFKIVAWGNRNTQLDKTKLTTKENIADLVVFIARNVSSIAEAMSFKPNDFIMFNQLYRRVRPFIIGLIDGRAIQGEDGGTRGEGTWWHWFGDQFARTPADLSFNTSDDIDNGKYRVRFAFKPIAANEYIGLDIAPADSATILNVQVLQQL